MTAMRRLWPCLLLLGCQRAETDYFQGYVEGEFVYVASSVAGDLQKLAVTKGQTVTAGAPLYQLDPNPQSLRLDETRQRMEQAQAKADDISKGSRPSELAAIEARLKKARATRDLAQLDFERRRELFELENTNAVSQEELDRFRIDVEVKKAEAETVAAELETARLGGRSDAVAAAAKEVGALAAALQELRWQLDEKSVASPAAGIVQDTLYREGEFVAAGRPVISLLPPENVVIRFFVPQALLPSIQTGDTVYAQLDGLDARVEAKVSYISPEAEFTPPVIYSAESRDKLVFLIEAVPDAGAAERLRPGQPLEVYLR